MAFNDKTITDLNSVIKCNAIEGVAVSDEQLEAIKEAANAQADFPVEEEIAAGFGNMPIIQQSKIGSVAPPMKNADLALESKLDIMNNTDLQRKSSLPMPGLKGL